MAYRISRNIEASLIDWLTTALTTAGYIPGTRVEKVFAEVYKGALPCICIEQNPEEDTLLEIGSKTWLKTFSISIRIFATSDGLRLDLKDLITDLLEDDIDYYPYTVVNGIVTVKGLPNGTPTGKIKLLKITRNEKELVNTENLVKEDKYRHIISFNAVVSI